MQYKDTPRPSRQHKHIHSLLDDGIFVEARSQSLLSALVADS
jgi:hypothetical protein